MTEPHRTYSDSRETHSAMRRLDPPGRHLTMRVVPPLLVLWELVRYVGKIFPETWNRFIFHRFWGDGILSTNAHFVMDSYEDIRLRSGFRHVETHTAGAQPEIFADTEIIHGTFFPQAVEMLTALFLQHTGKLVLVATDTEVEHAMNATLICYGNSDSNLKTFDIEISLEKALCQFVFDGTGHRAFQVGEQLYTIESRSGITYDKAILLRLTNPQNPNHCYVVCAGLSEWGSLAAVYYLTKKWKVLHNRFDKSWHRRDFCVLLDVQSGQFENAREVASVVRLAPLY
jgi:hypothetical protein